MPPRPRRKAMTITICSRRLSVRRPSLTGPLFSERDRWFESAFLQRGVRCELDPAASANLPPNHFTVPARALAGVCPCTGREKGRAGLILTPEGRLRVFGKSPRPNADCPRAVTKIISAHSGLVEANSIVRQPGVPVTRKFNPRSCASLVSLIKRGLVEGGPRLMQVT